MARIKLSDEFKAAVSKMPVKEKEKLLFRLLAKEPALVAKLEFELLEAGNTTEERRADLQQQIAKTLDNANRYFYSPGYLLLDLRALSGEITRHVATTKDKYGEIALNLFMLNTALDLMGDKIRGFSSQKSNTLDTYVVKRALKLLALLAKIHPDYQLDFLNDRKALGKHIGGLHNMMRAAIFNGLDVNLLLEG
ncbi:MAG: hypothetical protein DA408_04465 [Bacteroidetes bacterium]|nr:MAG: hypothetical protein C7N36_05345 [Bacteroidota bacterium]PTM13995.1 MAG: hypothetical protein DA408_04465 [Bacteroidota bacterium]